MGTLFSGIFDSELVSVISFSDFMLCMMCALVVGVILAGMYMYKNRYTKSFVATLALLPAIVCAVIMMVNGNVGTGVAVAGAFSLVRFRSVPGSAREIGALFLAMGSGMIAVEIGIGTGLQLQDILQFKVKDVRGKDMLIAVIGTRQIEQAFPLKPELQAVITDFIDGRDDDEYLITGYASTNRPLSREQAYRIFKQTGNKIGLKSIGTQTMRKTFAWRYYKETGDIQYIQNLLNHASPNITFRYIGEKPNIKVIYDKITDDGNQKAMEYLLKDKKGVRDIDAIILELKQIRRKLSGKRQPLPYYGRVDTLLEQMHDTLRDFNQSH